MKDETPQSKGPHSKGPHSESAAGPHSKGAATKRRLDDATARLFRHAPGAAELEKESRRLRRLKARKEWKERNP